MADASDTQNTPLYWRVCDALAVALVVVTVGGSILGLARFNGAHDFRARVEAEVSGLADRLAGAVAEAGPEAAEAFDAADLAAVAVVTSGGTDEFGISVGSGLPVHRVLDEAATPKDAEAYKQDLLNRSAELQDYHDKAQQIPRGRRFAAAEISDGETLFAAHAPVVAGGSYQGMVRLTKRVVTPAPATPTSTLLWMLLLSGALGFVVTLLPTPRRLTMGLAAGIPVLLLFTGQPGSYLVWSGLISLVLAFAAAPAAATVFRGVKEQPRTYLYVVPAMLGMLVLVFIPFVMGVAIAFFSDGEFTGFDNFREILTLSEQNHPNFYWTTGVTIIWTLSNVILHVSIGVTLALVLNRDKLAFKGVYRVLLIVPWAVPNYITALIWKSMFNPQYGAVNGLLDVIGVDPVNWLGPGSSFATNFLANLTTNTWLGFPFMMVVTLGALQSIPKELYEAADIDGAGRWQRFRQVTLPLLKPALIPAVILGVIWTFNMFNVIYLVSGGAPENETNILITEAYYAFRVLNRFGLAAAYSLLIFFMLLAYGWMQNRIARATEGAFE